MKKSLLGHGDYTQISNISGLSLSTVQKYYSVENFKVRPETELKLLDAYRKYLTSKMFGLNSYLEKLDDLKMRVSSAQSFVVSAIDELSKNENL